MAELLVPAAVERQRVVAEMELAHARHIEEFNRALREIDPYLDLVYVTKPPGEEVGPPVGLRWNRWHVRRTVPGQSFPTFWPIETPDGEFMEPHSGVFETLKEQDLWGRDGQRRSRERRLEEARLKQRAVEASRAEIREETQQRLKSLFDTQVSFGGRGWTAANAGRRGRNNRETA